MDESTILSLEDVQTGSLIACVRMHYFMTGIPRVSSSDACADMNPI